MTKQERLLDFIQRTNEFTLEEAMKAYVGEEQYDYLMGSINKFQKRLTRNFERKFEEKLPLDISAAVKQRLLQNTKTALARIEKNESVSIYNMSQEPFKKAKYRKYLSKAEEIVYMRKVAKKYQRSLEKHINKLRYTKLLFKEAHKQQPSLFDFVFEIANKGLIAV